MIESLLIDDMRAQAHEAFVLGHFKGNPQTSIERFDRLMSAPVRKGAKPKRGMSAETARRMARDLDAYDSQLAKGKVLEE